MSSLRKLLLVNWGQFDRVLFFDIFCLLLVLSAFEWYLHVKTLLYFLRAHCAHALLCARKSWACYTSQLCARMRTHSLGNAGEFPYFLSAWKRIRAQKFNHVELLNNDFEKSELSASVFVLCSHSMVLTGFSNFLIFCFFKFWLRSIYNNFEKFQIFFKVLKNKTNFID